VACAHFQVKAPVRLLRRQTPPGGLAGVDTIVKTHITHIPQKLDLRDRV
jgi:hypothetical protein